MVSNEVISGSKIAGEKLIEEGEVTSSSSDDGGQQTLPDDDFPKSKSSSKSSKKKSSKVSGSGFPVCEARKRRKLKKAKDRDKHDLKDPEKRSKKCKHSSKKTLDDPHANNGRKGFKPLRPEDDCSSSTKNVSSKEKLDIFGVDSSDSDDDLDTSHDNNDKDSIDGETSWAGVFSKPMPPKSSKGKYSSKHHHHLKTSSKSRSKDASGSKSRDPTSKSWYDLPDDNLSEFGFDHLDVKSIRAASVVGSPPRKTQEIMSPPHHKSSGRHSNSPPDRYGERGSHSRSRSRHDDYYYDDADGDRRRSHSRTKTRSPSPPVDDYYDSRHSRERDDRRAERQKDWKSKLVSTLRSLSPPDRIRRSRRSSPVIIDRRKDYRDARIFRPHPYIAKPDPSYRKRIEDDDPYYSNKSRDDHSRSHPDDRYHDSRKEYKREEREASVASTVASSVMTSVSKSSNRSRRSGRIYTEEEKIDKKKLLAIARANLAQMVEKGTLPKGVPIERFKLSHLFELKKAQSIQEYTEFCRAISAMEAAAYSDSDLSGSDEDSDDDDVKSVISHVTFGGRHPFELKERKDIQIKVRDFVALQTRTAPEIQEDLRETFPVSSGDRHRKIEWKDVDKVMPPPQMLPPSKLPPKKPKGPPKEQPDDSLTFLKAKEAAATTSTTTTPDAPEVEREIIGPVLPGSAEGTPAATGTPGTPSSTGEGSSLSTSVYPDESEAKRISIGAVMAMRLGAMKILQTDPTNAVALKQMADAQKMMDDWSTSQVKPGQFTGSTGARVLSPGQLEAGNPAWVNRDVFKTAVAIDGGIGRYLLKKMGWEEGQGLGRKNDGTVEPLMPILKFDTKGLVAEEERIKKLAEQMMNGGIEPLQSGKYPVSQLLTYCTRKKLGNPEYVMAEADGPPHKPNFTMKVRVGNIWYQPAVSVRNKKQAKHLAASVCLQAFGLLPEDTPYTVTLATAEEEEKPDPETTHPLYGLL